ncbi:rolling circle replication-associated protein [Epilithonimonas mollis]|uniref:Replication-associated protein ORF2/G2P domain-containing protein n=1 Tax=Epilithonimonas mollis TaxID=216903 RepID=A0A1M6U2R8_9FLAO|nr:hypothetical protein [Epilithonimonas mollis]SHK63459.1 hypothetical protein SAMN05444371_3086 [Epilithonimonas mollis]
MVESVAKVKKRSIVYYTRFSRKKYNEKSLNNLKQNLKTDENKMLQKLRNQSEIECINSYVSTYKMAYEQTTQKPLKTKLSKQQASKISEITNVFIQSLLSQFKPQSGFNQRSVTFALLTLPTQNQHVSDKKVISQLVKFIDDLKRVKNYIICPVTKHQTKDHALSIENYIWRAETTENGVIHFHILFDSFINKNVLKRVWNNHLEKLGFERSYNSAHIHSVKNLRDLGAYVTKYLTKEPLRDKYKHYTKDQLRNIPDSEKYRRPVIGKVWGCSKAVLKLKYIDFVESDQAHIEELRTQMKEYKSEKLPDFVSVYVGNVKECLKKCSIKLQSMFKKWHQRQYEFLYNYKSMIMEKSDQIITYGKKELHNIYKLLEKRNISYNPYKKVIIIPTDYDFEKDKDLMILRNHFGYQFIRELNFSS